MNEYIGNEFQLYGVEKYCLSEGKAKGMEIYHAKNGKGLDLCVSLNRNGDISQLSYKGINLSYLSPVGYVNSSYYDDKGNGFLKSFTAGFLTTCGLTTFGTPSLDNGEELPLHGTISNIPTSNSSYEVTDKEIIIKTTTRDEGIFSHKLVLKRTISISLIANEFTIHDEIINTGDQESPLMILYHMNIGYPLLDENSELKINSSNIIARNEHANEFLKEWNLMDKPTPNYLEMCYYHKFSKKPEVSIYNKKLNVGLSIDFNKENLDCFTEWKMMGVRDYVLGLEPGNAYPDGRDEMRKKNILKFIQPNETKEYEVKIKIFSK